MDKLQKEQRESSMQDQADEIARIRTRLKDNPALLKPSFLKVI
jgi:hypothetical protein